MGPEADAGLLAPSDIAELVGVTRAAVSNWRKRRPDFPGAAGGTVAKPLFNRADVEQWLLANGYSIPRDTGELAVWALINRFRDELPLQLTRALVHAVLCARKLADDAPVMDDLSNAASEGHILDALHKAAECPDADPRWCELVTDDLESLIDRYGVGQQSRPAIDRLVGALFMVVSWVDAGKLADVSDHVLGRVGAAEGRMAGEHGVVGSRISQLLAQGGSGIAGIAYDPACGIGEALLRLWQASPASNRLRLVGTDVDRESVLVAKQRCFLYGAEATIERADVLERDPDPGLLADVVVAEPPFGLAMPTGFSLTDSRWALAGPPPKKNAEIAWLQHAIAHLAPTGRGFVVTGLGTTSSTSSAQIRRALVWSRSIEAVIALPPKMLLHTARPTVLWVLRSTNAPKAANQVLFIDASQLDPTDSFPFQTWLLQPEKYVDTHLSWACVAIGDLLANDQFSLDPRHWTQKNVDVEQITERYHRAASDLSEAIEFLMENRNLAIDRKALASHTVSIRTLEQQGALQITQSRSKPGDIESAGQDGRLVTTRMIKDAFAKFPASLPVPETDSRSPADDYTEPGDVLVTIKRTIRAVVDEIGGRALGPGVIRVRVDQGQFEPHYFAECLAASWNQQFETGSSVPHAGLRDLDIPLIALDEQVQLMKNINRARRVSAAAKRVSSACEAIATVRLEATRFNVQLTQT